jgi:hypothetical protein
MQNVRNIQVLCHTFWIIPVLFYDMIHLTAIGLTHDGSSTVQYSTHLRTKQYIEQHIIDTKQYMEQHNSRIRKSADCAPSLRGVPWHLPYN